MNPTAARRRAQIDIRRSAALVALILAFLAGWFAGSASHGEPTAPCDPPYGQYCPGGTDMVE